RRGGRGGGGGGGAVRVGHGAVLARGRARDDQLPGAGVRAEDPEPDAVPRCRSVCGSPTSSPLGVQPHRAPAVAPPEGAAAGRHDVGEPRPVPMSPNSTVGLVLAGQGEPPDGSTSLPGRAAPAGGPFGTGAAGSPTAWGQATGGSPRGAPERRKSPPYRRVRRRRAVRDRGRRAMPTSERLEERAGGPCPRPSGAARRRGQVLAGEGE